MNNSVLVYEHERAHHYIIAQHNIYAKYMVHIRVQYYHHCLVFIYLNLTGEWPNAAALQKLQKHFYGHSQ